jgi:thiol-disulfide isomerase/thioredoxin
MMPRQAALAACAVLVLAGPSRAGLEIAPGLTRDEVIERIGEPSGELDYSERHIMIYDGAVVELSRGFVTFISPDFEKRVERRQAQAAFEEAQRAKGLEFYEGTWRTREEIRSLHQARVAPPAAAAPAARPPAPPPAPASPPAPPAQATASGGDDVVVISEGGRAVDLARITVPGKVTIVDFYADWCGPCRRISPELDRMARGDADVVLRKVDIVKWGTPVTAQYGIRSVPSVRVYDRSGRPVGSPTHSIQDVQRLVGRAK